MAMLLLIWVSRRVFTSESSTVSANSRISSRFKRLRSAASFSSSAWSASSRISPFFSILVTLMWSYLISRQTVSSPAHISITIWSTTGVSRSSTLQISASRSSRQRFLPSSVTFERTSISSDASPATAPRTTPAGIPFNPPEFGMMTQRTFFIIFPEHFATICSGSLPRTSLALAAP